MPSPLSQSSFSSPPLDPAPEGGQGLPQQKTPRTFLPLLLFLIKSEGPMRSTLLVLRSVAVLRNLSEHWPYRVRWRTARRVVRESSISQPARHPVFTPRLFWGERPSIEFLLRAGERMRLEPRTRAKRSGPLNACRAAFIGPLKGFPPKHR